MKITDLEIAEFCGTSDRTLRNYKKPIEENGVKYYPPCGLHNMYKGAKIATYLLKYADNGEESEQFNNLDLLVSNAEALVEYLNIIQKGELEEYFKNN